MQSITVVDDFLSRYNQGEKYRYEQAAERARRLCEKALNLNGIRAIVSSRAKDLDRLKEKLQLRRPNGYPSRESILDDIVDLAGVRIALYFPDDRASVETLIYDIFEVNTKKKFPSSDEGTRDAPAEHEPFRRRFDGYCADHYRVHLKDNKEKSRKLKDALIEIQVATLLMHAWSEVNHDLDYKQVNGIPSGDELRILDGINGLVIASELFLKQLQGTVQQRIKAANRSFDNHFELGAFVQQRISDQVTSKIGPVDILFTVLKALELDSPQKLEPRLHGWNEDSARSSSAVMSILDHILPRRVPSVQEGSNDFQSIQAQNERTTVINAAALYEALLLGESRLGRTSVAGSDQDEFNRLYGNVRRWAPLYETSASDYNTAVTNLRQWFDNNEETTAQVSLRIASLNNPLVVELIRSTGDAIAEYQSELSPD